MTSIAIIGTAISATLVIAITVALTLIGRKVAPPLPQIHAETATQDLLEGGEPPEAGHDATQTNAASPSEAAAESLHG